MVAVVIVIVMVVFTLSIIFVLPWRDTSTGKWGDSELTKFLKRYK